MREDPVGDRVDAREAWSTPLDAPLYPRYPIQYRDVEFLSLQYRTDPDAIRRLVPTLHLPMTDETRGLIGATEMSLMPRGAIIVNVSRGGLVDQMALRAALADGHLSGAALDVLAPEPPPADDPILDTPNLLLSPHIAWYSSASELRVRTQVVDGVLRCLAGEAPATGRIALDPRIAAAG